jgi:hypothetical protein
MTKLITPWILRSLDGILALHGLSRADLTIVEKAHKPGFVHDEWWQGEVMIKIGNVTKTYLVMGDNWLTELSEDLRLDHFGIRLRPRKRG